MGERARMQVVVPDDYNDVYGSPRPPSSGCASGRT